MATLTPSAERTQLLGGCYFWALWYHFYTIFCLKCLRPRSDLDTVRFLFKLFDEFKEGLNSHFYPKANCSQVFILHEADSGELSDSLALEIFIERFEAHVWSTAMRWTWNQVTWDRTWLHDCVELGRCLNHSGTRPFHFHQQNEQSKACLAGFS